MPLGALLRIEAGNQPRDPGFRVPRNGFVRMEFHASVAHTIPTPREIASLVEEGAEPVARFSRTEELHPAPIWRAADEIERDELESLLGDGNLESRRGQLKCLEHRRQARISRELPA